MDLKELAKKINEVLEENSNNSLDAWDKDLEDLDQIINNALKENIEKKSETPTGNLDNILDKKIIYQDKQYQELESSKNLNDECYNVYTFDNDIDFKVYVDREITKQDVSIRTYNVLRKNGICTTQQLIRTPIEDIEKFFGVGRKVIDDIRKFTREYLENPNNILPLKNKTNSSYNENSLHLTENIKQNINKNIDKIAQGNFSVLNNIVLDKNEKLIIQTLKNDYNILDKELVKIAFTDPKKIIPIIKMLDNFSIQTDRFIILNEKIKHVPYKVQQFSMNLISKINLILAKECIYGKAYIDEMKNLFTKLSPNEKEMTLYEYIESFDTIEYATFRKLSCLLEKLQFDIANEVNEFFNKIFLDDRVKEICIMRSKGKTLNDLSDILDISRERVRQIESKQKDKFEIWNNKNNILLKLSILNGLKSTLSKNDIEKYLGATTNVFMYFLKETSKVCIYYRDSDLFVLNSVLVEKEKEFIDILPDIISKDKLESLLNEAKELWNFPSDIVENIRMVIQRTYKFNGTIYSRRNLSLTYIYGEVMKKYYKNGIHIYDHEELTVFKKHILDDFGNLSLPNSDRAISARLSNIGILCDRGTYMPKRKKYISEDLSNEIYNFIKTSELPIFPINTIYNIYEDDLLEYNVDNRYYLQGILKSLYGNEFVFTRDYIAKDVTSTSFKDEIVNFIKDSPFIVTRDEIKNNFIGTSEVVLSFAVSDHSIINYFGEYLHEDKLSITPNELSWLKSIITKFLSDNTSHNVREIYDYVMSVQPEILTRNGVKFQFSFFSLIEHLFKNEYKFSRPYISYKNVKIDHPIEIIHDYIYSREDERIFISDIMDIAREHSFQIPSKLDFINSYNDDFFIINKNEIASKKYIGITEENVKKLENILIPYINETIPINEVINVFGLPTILVPWTDWLIYSLLNKWGEKLEVSVSNTQMRFAIPLISPIGKMNEEKFYGLKSAEKGEKLLSDDFENLLDIVTDMIEYEDIFDDSLDEELLNDF